MEADAAKLIGAGLATIALAGVGVGIGNIFGSFVSGALRNPAGIDIPALHEYAAANKKIAGFAGAEAIPASALLAEVCDVLVPAALTGLVALTVAVFGASVLAQLLLRPIHVIRSGLTRLGRGESGVQLDLGELHLGLRRANSRSTSLGVE